MKRRIAFVASLVAVCSLGCPSPPAASDADASSDATSDRPADAVTETGDSPGDNADASPPAPQSCTPCIYSSECGEGGLCIDVDDARAPGWRECRAACATVGEPCSARGVAGVCTLGPTGTPVCQPNPIVGGDGGALGPCFSSRRGIACPSGGRCIGRYSVCAEGRPTEGNVCLAPCNRDSDCEDAYARCRDVVPSGGGTAVRACIPDDIIGPERCGAAPVNVRGIGAPCGGMAMRTCATGLECVSGIDAMVGGFCTATCAADGDCGGNARCLGIGTIGNRCVPADCECITGAHDALLDRALTGAMWTRCNLYFARTSIDVFSNATTHDRFRLPVFDRIHRDWMAGARWARELGPSLDTRVTGLSTLIAASSGLRTTGRAADGRVGAIVPPVAGDTPLVDAVAALITAFGGMPDRAAIGADATDVPMPLQRALSAIVTAIERTGAARDRGLIHGQNLDDRDYLFEIATHWLLGGRGARPDPREPLDMGSLLGDVVLPVDEATALAATIEQIDWAPFRGVMGVSFDQATPIGRIIVRDGATTMHAGTSYTATALVLDLGGDDTYQASVGANVDATNSVSVVIDLAGNDRYAYAERPIPQDAAGFLPSDVGGRITAGSAPASLSEVGRQGAGRLGVGLAYDFGSGTDVYRSLRASQGSGALGIGGLMDDGGNDTYDNEALGQGAAIGGIGVLLDLGGDDQYTTWYTSQGFAWVRGVGVLYDRAGTDTYLARETPVAYTSPQNPMVNSSMSQGVGFGRRADFLPDRINMSGGIGVLRDLAGDDHYRSSIFGTATGYWGGMGLLLEAAGNDSYDGRWYTQGGDAHFAYTALVDNGGRDVHNMVAPRQNMTAGAGHDWSVGFLLADGSDDDVYNVPNLALGAGNANGAGFFVDRGGNDTYNAASALTCGNAALESLTDPGRLARPTVGVFLDGGGTDMYMRGGVTMDPVRNDSTWTQRIHMEAPSETGVGADGTGDVGM